MNKRNSRMIQSGSNEWVWEAKPRTKRTLYGNVWMKFNQVYRRNKIISIQINIKWTSNLIDFDLWYSTRIPAISSKYINSSVLTMCIDDDDWVLKCPNRLQWLFSFVLIQKYINFSKQHLKVRTVIQLYIEIVYRFLNVIPLSVTIQLNYLRNIRKQRALKQTE